MLTWFSQLISISVYYYNSFKYSIDRFRSSAVLSRGIFVLEI